MSSRPIIACPTCGAKYRECPADPGCANCLMAEDTARIVAKRKAALDLITAGQAEQGPMDIDALFATIGLATPGRNTR